MSPSPLAQSGTFTFGTTTVHRLGYGAMQITGKGVWGPPSDKAEAIRVLRHCVELGVDFIDTADSYGPYVSEELIREALHPYKARVVIATKAGLVRTGPNLWIPVGRPEYLRQECEMSLRRLGLERIDLFQLHRIDPKVPAAEQFGLLAELQKEGKILHVGLSEVSVAEIEAASAVVRIATVQNRYNLVDRGSEAVLDYCTQHAIGVIPWFPMAAGTLSRPGGILDVMAKKTSHTPGQLALAGLLQRSPVMLPIPGTSTVAHLTENCDAGKIRLTAQEYSQLEHAAKPA